MALSPVRNERFAPVFESSRYQRLEKIGEGGFGQVYKALQVATGLTVAIKSLTLSPDADRDQRDRYLARFERETLLCSKLQNHQNIVSLLDKGISDNGLVYAVFEFVEGYSLKEHLLRKGPLSPTETVAVMSQVLDALAHAHAQGIVHRDIKPANIMLSEVGSKLHVKILDFGIGALSNEARHLDYKSLTLTQETLGTPSYSAPEQLRGEPPSPKTDLYVWGLVFIECLTAVPAVSGSSLASIFQKQLNPGDVPLPPAMAGHPIAVLLRRVLNKDTHVRADSAQDIAKALSRINVSNLVGKLDQMTISHSPGKANGQGVVDDKDKTLLNQSGFLDSGFTERKQISVMCVRLSTHSCAGERSDGDIVDALHRDQKAQCVDVVVGYGGTHVGTLGDTLLFYFGYPTVSDNDGRLCARAALEFISHLNKRNALLKDTQEVFAAAYIGIHSGLVTTYADNIPEGDTPNIAMQLSRIASANQILCSEVTRRLIDSYVELEAKDVLPLGVNGEKTHLYAISGERLVEAFGFLRANKRHNIFIGRDKELTRLLDLFAPSVHKDSTNAVVHIHGEAGIGKSRLISELRDKTPHYEHFVAQCLPEQVNNALFPILNLLKYKYSFEALQANDTVVRLQYLLAEQTVVEIDQALAILCIWLNLNVEDEMSLPDNLSADELKAILFSALAFLLHRRAGEATEQKLYIFEDIHWADPVSLEFINYFVASDYFHGVFITTSRESLPANLDAQKHQCLPVQKLSHGYTAEFIHHLFRQQQVSSEVIDLIVSRTDGIPLFIEEFSNMLEQKRLVRHLNGKIEFVSKHNITELPKSLRDSLQQNLDRLNNGKEIAQLAAAIGREFSHAFILQCCQRDEAWLQMELQELLQAELIYVQRRTSGDSYIFKHALVRDVAYDSMPAKRKQYAHQQIAQTLEQRKDSVKDNAALLATHWAAATAYDKAVYYGNLAAKAALKRSSSNEAILQAEKVQSWIECLDKDEQTNHLLDNYSLLTSAYMEAKGWGAMEVLEYSQKSLDLLASTKRYDELVSHLWWKVLNGIVGGRREGLDKLCDQMEKIIGFVSDINQSAIRCAQGFYYFTEGDRNASIEALQAAIDLYDGEADKSHQQTFGFDVGIFAQATIARTYADQNQDDKAEYYSDMALRQSKASEHIPSIGIALMYHGLVYQHYQNKGLVEQSASELIALSDQYDLPIYRGFGQMLFDWSQGDVSRADQILDTLKQAGSKHGLAHFQSFYADTYADQQNYALALEKIDQCIALDDSIKEMNYVGYLFFKKARYLLLQQAHELTDSNRKNINDLIPKARAIAEQQGIYFIIEELNNMPASFIDKAG